MPERSTRECLLLRHEYVMRPADMAKIRHACDQGFNRSLIFHVGVCCCDDMTIVSVQDT